MSTVATMAILFSALFFTMQVVAQDSRGGCSITLLSDPSTASQGGCLVNVEYPLEPVVYLIQGNGLTVTGLPNGVSYSLSSDTLTFTGTIIGPGFGTITITLDGECEEDFRFFIGQEVDPELACTVSGNGITLSWPGYNTPMSSGGTLYITWTGGDEVGTEILFLPEVQSWTFTDLPLDTPVTFSLYAVDALECPLPTTSTTCTIVSTGLDEQDDIAPPVYFVLDGDRLQVSASSMLKDVRIYSAEGRLLGTHPVNSTVAEISTTALSAGAYIALVRDGHDRLSPLRFVER